MNPSSPFTFNIDENIAKALDAFIEKTEFTKLSEVVRAALEERPIEEFEVKKRTNRQVSVRIDSQMRDKLNEHAKRNNCSMGELVRLFLFDFIGKQKNRSKTPASKPTRSKQHSQASQLDFLDPDTF
ncbi:MAG: hypothetical protein JJT75_09130 [Opitutales bacterium]|nr:hypothetical protein [Opitutales bacterium]